MPLQIDNPARLEQHQHELLQHQFGTFSFNHFSSSLQKCESVVAARWQLAGFTKSVSTVRRSSQDSGELTVGLIVNNSHCDIV